MKRRTFLGAAAAVSLAQPALAQKSRDTLRVVWRDAVPDVDPYRNSLRTGLILAHEGWDTLVYRDPHSFKIVPALATAWDWSNPMAIDFTLRDGVTFHNGDAFNADDVVYTFETILKDPMVAVPSNFAFLAGAEKLGDMKVRLKLKNVFPAALEYLAMTLPVYPKTYREKVGPAGYSKQPVGTGPYKITRVNGTSEVDFERFDGYYKDSPKGRPAIKYLKVIEVLDEAGELTAFISGQADWIWQYNPDQFQSLQGLPGKTAVRAGSMRMGYLELDAAGRAGNDAPLANEKVRQAIFHSIDRASMAHNLVQGDSHPVAAPCYPTQFGCDQAAAVDYNYDPAKAKALLAEAGYPQGFSTTLVSYLLPAWNAALQNYMKAVGISVDIQQLQVGAVVQKVAAGQTPMNAGSWGSYSINDVSAILPYFFGGGSNDYSRNPKVEELLKAGGSVTDPAARQKNYSEAIHIVTDQAYWLPLFTFVTYYAFSADLDFEPFQDELPRFYLCKWK